MNVVVSIAAHEIEMARRWFDWVIELGGTEGHSIFMIPASGLPIAEIVAKAVTAFGGRVTIIVDEEAEKSDWQISEPTRSASGPNSAFRQVAWYFYHKKLGPYFWCELDCIPLKKEWLDQLEAEYKECGKPFMGANVEIANVPPHMSGNGIYTDIIAQAPSLVMRTNWSNNEQSQSFELAFDIAGAREVIPRAHWTKLIQHKFRYEGFKSRQEFDAVIDPSAVVFHSDKSGSIYPYLRENLSGGEKQPCKHGAAEAKDGLNSAIVQPNNAPPPAQKPLTAVPALAEPPRCDTTASGEARESEKPERRGISAQSEIKLDSRGGSQTPSRTDLVKDAVSVLKSLCTSPHATSQVRKELKRQKVITKI